MEGDPVLKKQITIEEMWSLLSAHQGEVFYTAKKLPFTYMIKGGELFVDRRSKSITKATFEQAISKLESSDGTIAGPKSLCVFGAPYVWALFRAFEIV